MLSKAEENSIKGTTSREGWGTHPFKAPLSVLYHPILFIIKDEWQKLGRV